MNDNMLVDTNILVYLVDKNNIEKHLKAKQLLETIKQSANYFVSLQNLREFSAVANKKSFLSPKEINAFIEIFSNSFKLIADNQGDIAAANNLREATKTHFWDALLASTMQRNGVKTILTENTKDFKEIKNIHAINPLE